MKSGGLGLARRRRAALGSLAAAGAGTLLAIGLLAARRRHFELRGRVALVTGGSRGLGLVLARELVRNGARVAICARDPAEVARAAADLRSRGGEVLELIGDVTQPEAVQRMIREVRDGLGTIDVLINNAGIIQVGPIELQSEQDFEDAMQVHFWGPLRTMLAVLPEMRARRSGRIVNVASIGGKIAVPHMAPYCASKFALVGLSSALRAELSRDGVFVTTVCPGMIRTGSHVNARFKHRDEYGWFSAMNGQPIVSIGAERAARAILAGARAGRPYVIVPTSAKLALLLNGLLPETALRVTSVASHLLPAPDGKQPQDLRGIECRASASQWTRRVDLAAGRNNELRPEEALS